MRASVERIFCAFRTACQQPATFLGLSEHAALRAVTVPFFSRTEALAGYFDGSVSASRKPCASAALITSCSGSSWYRASHQSRRFVDNDGGFDEFAQRSRRNVKHMLLDPVSMLNTGRGLPLGFAARNSDQEAHSNQPDRSASDSLQQDATAPDEVDLSSLEDAGEPVPTFLFATASGRCSEDGELAWSCFAAGSADYSPSHSSSDPGDATSSSGGSEKGGGDQDEDAEALRLFSEDGDELKSINQLKEDLKRLDQVFEALAEVPWLDDTVIQEREQKGMLAVAMLGTLEEAGWKVRQGVHRIWSGERDMETVSKGAPPREQAALLSVLYHTRSIEDKFGPPPTPWKPATDFLRLYEGETVPYQEAGPKKSR